MAAITRTSTVVSCDPPTRVTVLVFDDPQQLCLQGRAHVADLVEENGPALRQLELAGPRRDAGGRARFDPEELGLKQALRHGRAVDRDERMVGARAGLVQGAGDEFLARAALAANQHRYVGRGHARYERQHVEHLAVAAHHAAKTQSGISAERAVPRWS